MTRTLWIVLCGSAAMLGARNLLRTFLAVPDANPPPFNPFPFESVVDGLANALWPALLWTLGCACVVAFVLFVLDGPVSAALARAEVKELGLRAKDDVPDAIARRAVHWLTTQQLPLVTGPHVKRLVGDLEAIARQLAGHKEETLPASALGLRNLLGTELPELVIRFHRVPRAARSLPSVREMAEKLLTKGLESVGQQLQDIHKELAERELQGLAIQARFLELKYDPNAPAELPHVGGEVAAARPDGHSEPAPRPKRQAEQD